MTHLIGKLIGMSIAYVLHILLPKRWNDSLKYRLGQHLIDIKTGAWPNPENVVRYYDSLEVNK